MTLQLKIAIGEQVIELNDAQARQLHAELNLLLVDGAPLTPPPHPWMAEVWATI